MLARIAHLLKTKPPVSDDRGFLFASGASKPTDGTDGFQASCLFQDTTNGIMYVNEGSITSCDFNALGDLTSVDYSEGGTTAITISGVYTVEGISIENSSVHGIRVGAFTSGGLTTNAMVLDGTTSTAVEIHAGVSTDPGSGSNLRPLRSRFIVNTGDTVEAETYAMQGQLVVKSSTLGHWHGGAMGTIECQTAMTVSNVLAGVGALFGRIGGSGITVNSSCYLAGVVSLASAASVTNNGVYAGLYVTKTSGSSNFSHGAYIENSDVGIQILSGNTPDTSRTYHGFVMGGRSTAELAVAFVGGAGAENFEPIQLNFNLTGTNPASTSTINIIQQGLYHDTDDMDKLRLKCADWWVTVNKDCTDVYCIQNEINFGTGTPTVSGEVAVLGLVLDGGASGTLTCPYYHGINMTMRGAETPANASGLFVRVESGATVTNGIELRAEGTMTTGIRFGNISGDECPSHVIAVPTAGTGVTTGSVDAAGDGEGSIAIQVGGVTKYLQYWPSATA